MKNIIIITINGKRTAQGKVFIYFLNLFAKNLRSGCEPNAIVVDSPAWAQIPNCSFGSVKSNGPAWAPQSAVRHGGSDQVIVK